MTVTVEVKDGVVALRQVACMHHLGEQMTVGVPTLRMRAHPSADRGNLRLQLDRPLFPTFSFHLLA